MSSTQQDQQRMLHMMVLRPSKTPRGVLTGYEMRFCTSNLEDNENVDTGICNGVYYQLDEHPATMSKELCLSKCHDLDVQIKKLQQEKAMVEEAAEEFCRGQEPRVVDIMQGKTYDVTKSALMTKEFKA